MASARAGSRRANRRAITQAHPRPRTLRCLPRGWTMSGLGNEGLPHTHDQTSPPSPSTLASCRSPCAGAAPAAPPCTAEQPARRSTGPTATRRCARWSLPPCRRRPDQPHQNACPMSRACPIPNINIHRINLTSAHSFLETWPDTTRGGVVVKGTESGQGQIHRLLSGRPMIMISWSC